MSDTYIPSGEESAQEQQFLQALVGQIQSRDACPIPKYASQIFCNFMGNYSTLTVNPTMLNAVQGVSYPGMSDYRGFFITTDGNGGPSNTVFRPLMGGNPAGSMPTSYSPFYSPSPTYYPSVLDWAWPYNPTQVIGPINTPPPVPFNFVPNYPNLAFYRQSFTPSPFYIFMPKWMKSFTVGMRLYDNLGVLQPILIASKTNAKWQNATINSGTAPDGSYTIESLTPVQLQSALGDDTYNRYVSATLIGGSSFSSQEASLAKSFIYNSFNESPSGGSSQITASIANYAQPNTNFIPSLSVVYWTDTAFHPYDGFNASGTAFSSPVPNIPDYSRYPLPNQTYTFSLPAPPSLPYLYYFWIVPTGLQVGTIPRLSTFSAYYPSDYPNSPVVFTIPPASFDIAKVTIANYVAVNPQPAGFPAPPVGIPTFNSLDLSTMPLIGVDITAPL